MTTRATTKRKDKRLRITKQTIKDLNNKKGDSIQGGMDRKAGASRTCE